MHEGTSALRYMYITFTVICKLAYMKVSLDGGDTEMFVNHTWALLREKKTARIRWLDASLLAVHPQRRAVDHLD